jgi:hypothetical protein
VSYATSLIICRRYRDKECAKSIRNENRSSSVFYFCAIRFHFLTTSVAKPGNSNVCDISEITVTAPDDFSTSTCPPQPKKSALQTTSKQQPVRYQFLVDIFGNTMSALSVECGASYLFQPNNHKVSFVDCQINYLRITTGTEGL